MKINLNKNDLKEFDRILETKEINISVADMFIDYVENYANNITDANMLLVDEDSQEESYLQLVLENLEIDMNNIENKAIVERFILPGVNKQDLEEYQNNPYYKNINPADEEFKNWRLEFIKYKPFECFFSNDVTVFPDDYYKEVTNIGFFNKETKYLAVLENDMIWMAIIPNEITTMQKPIADAYGNVITFGLGLGYFAYMSALKEEVKHVTIVEKDETVIKIFNEYLLPKFVDKDKITIVKADAKEYLNSKDFDKNNYDFLFIDLWHNPNDGLEYYIDFKNQEPKHSKTTFSYWLEQGILCLLRRCLISLIDEEINGSDDTNYQESECYTDKVINTLHYLLKEKELNSFEQIKMLLSDESLRSISKDLFI